MGKEFDNLKFHRRIHYVLQMYNLKFEVISEQCANTTMTRQCDISPNNSKGFNPKAVIRFKQRFL